MKLFTNFRGENDPDYDGIKEICKNNIQEPLKILNIKQINGNYGIRVIPRSLYVKDTILESNIFFSDD